VLLANLIQTTRLFLEMGSSSKTSCDLSLDSTSRINFSTTSVPFGTRSLRRASLPVIESHSRSNPSCLRRLAPYGHRDGRCSTFALTHNSTNLPMYHHTLRHHHRLLSRAPPPPQRDETNKTPHLILDTSSSLDPPLRGFPVEVHSHTLLRWDIHTTQQLLTHST